ncbi:type I secretion system permease/ATPase [Azospirillum sp. SYSU D00513]|uniref:type I secretion system permease/ATPase n=1 Tax=Azospirillum sp. SYSU D00513 TaxID=2812561 RepID=UPI001A95AE37|nr:type I secretion system permease/ATPase [Azospirillum sp. SYSU D00513]
MNGPSVLAKIGRQCVRGLLLSFALSVPINLLMLVSPLYMVQLFDRVLGSGNLNTLFWLTVIALGALAVHALLDYTRTRLHQALGHWLNRRLGFEALEAIVRGVLRGGGDPSRSLQDVAELRGFVAGRAIPSALEFLISPLFLAALFLMHPFYAAVAAGGAFLMLVIAVVNEVATFRPIRQANESAGRSTSAIGAALRNAEVIEGMGMMPAILRRWWKLNQETLRHADEAARRSAAISALSGKIRNALQMAVMATGAALVVNHMASPGTMFGAMIITGFALGPFQALIDGWRQWVGAYASLKRLQTVLEPERDGMERSTMPLPAPEGPLVVERLVFVPPGASKPALKGVSFTVEPGEVLAVVGRSAAGKSTLARMLVGLWKPTAGSIRLDGHDVHGWDRASFGSYVGFLPQNVSLFDGTVRENIARLEASDPRDVVEVAKLCGVHEIVGRLPLGYDTPIGEGSYLLTGGQRQRVGLARALYGRPRLLVLDEPDTSLDAEGEQALVRAMLAAKADGAIVVVVTHRQAALDAADRILVLNDGQVERIETRGNQAPAADGPARLSGQGAQAALTRPAPALAGGDPKRA